LDEITTTGPSHVAELKNGRVTQFEVTPEAAGLSRAKPADIKGADAATNAAAITALLAGKAGPYRDIVLLNSAAALLIAGKAGDLKSGAALAASAIDSGKAKAVLAQLVAITNRPMVAAI
jgi:anthranilate phosphoribosyltransferase